MSGPVKAGIVIGIIGVAMWLISRAQQQVNNFGIDLKKIGIPKFSGSVVTLPLDIAFNNTTGITINIPDFVADLYVQDANGQWKKGGYIQQTITLPPGQSEKRIEPKIDLKQIFGGNMLNTLTSILANIKSKSITVKGTASGTANGVPLQAVNLIPQQTISL